MIDEHNHKMSTFLDLHTLHKMSHAPTLQLFFIVVESSTVDPFPDPHGNQRRTSGELRSARDCLEESSGTYTIHWSKYVW